jgi:thioredoxin-like negative regulator of GroEL
MRKILYFSAAWCGPCKTLGPIMQESTTEGVVYDKIDVDSDNILSAKYNVRNIPTLILLDEFGNEIGRKVGLQTKQNIINFYNG